MGHMNRHRKHGKPPRHGPHRSRSQEKRFVAGRKMSRRRRKAARARDRQRLRDVIEEYGCDYHRMCTSKRYYGTRELVESAMVHVEAIFGDKCYGYRCPVCGGWHISTHDLGSRNEAFTIGGPVETFRGTREVAVCGNQGSCDRRRDSRASR